MWKAIISLLTWFLKRMQYKTRLETKIDDIFRRVLRLEIIEAMRRKDTKTVYELGDLYKSLGFNSYMSEMVEDYKKKHSITKRKKK